MHSRREMKLTLATIITVFAIMVAGAMAADVYVDDSATGPNYNGTPGDPYKKISNALADTGLGAGDTIHVAAGLYDVTHNGESFPLTMLDGVSLSGEDRDRTILDAEGDTYTSYHVIYCDNVNNFTVENLAITGGNANGSGWDRYGAGICCYESSPTISNCIISGNEATLNAGGFYCYRCSATLNNCIVSGNKAQYGGGLACHFSGSPTLSNCEISGNEAQYGGGISCVYGNSPTLTNCRITGNAADSLGGGGYCQEGLPTLIDCEVSGNTAAQGGGIYSLFAGSLALTNCLVAGNTSSNDGGGLYCIGGPASLTNCTFSGNGADDAGAIFWPLVDGQLEITNCVLWGDHPDEIAGDPRGVIVTYSDIQDGWTGEGNIDKDPGFVPLDGDGEHIGYYLMHAGPQAKDSACIDAGTGSLEDYGTDGITTCTDGAPDGDDDGNGDTGPIDMGYHYPDGYSGSGDTYIQLASFTARAAVASILLEWETGAEVDNAGFVIFRTVAGQEDYAPISDLIAAEGSPSLGASYSFVDSNVSRGVTYSYWLVDIDTSGKWMVHGPASARLSLGRLESPPHTDSLKRAAEVDRLESPSAHAGGQPGKAVLHHQPPTINYQLSTVRYEGDNNEW